MRVCRRKWEARVGWDGGLVVVEGWGVGSKCLVMKCGLEALEEARDLGLLS